jgi:hypothetical protein
MSTSPMGRGQRGDFPMKNYSIVRDGNEYVVRAGEKSVLKISSRRRAAKLVTDAVELLGQRPVASTEESPSIICDAGIIPHDPELIPCDPQATSSDLEDLPEPAQVP